MVFNRRRPILALGELDPLHEQVRFSCEYLEQGRPLQGRVFRLEDYGQQILPFLFAQFILVRNEYTLECRQLLIGIFRSQLGAQRLVELLPRLDGPVAFRNPFLKRFGKLFLRSGFSNSLLNSRQGFPCGIHLRLNLASQFGEDFAALLLHPVDGRIQRRKTVLPPGFQKAQNPHGFGRFLESFGAGYNRRPFIERLRRTQVFDRVSQPDLR